MHCCRFSTPKSRSWFPTHAAAVRSMFSTGTICLPCCVLCTGRGGVGGGASGRGRGVVDVRGRGGVRAEASGFS